MILTGPFLLETFCDCMALLLRSSSAPRADALQLSPVPSGDHVVCSEDIPGSKSNVGNGDTEREEQLCQSWAAPNSRGAQAAQPQQSQRT